MYRSLLEVVFFSVGRLKSESYDSCFMDLPFSLMECFVLYSVSFAGWRQYICVVFFSVFTLHMAFTHIDIHINILV